MGSDNSINDDIFPITIYRMRPTSDYLIFSACLAQPCLSRPVEQDFIDEKLMVEYMIILLTLS